MICALSQLRVIEHIAQRQEKRAGWEKKNLCKVLRRHAGQVESLDNPKLQHDHTYQQRQHPPSTIHARHSATPPPKKGKTIKPVNAKHRSSTTPLRALCKHWQQAGEKLKSRQGLVWRRGAWGGGPRARRRSNPSYGRESELSTSGYGRRMKTRFQHLRKYFRPLIAHLVPKQYLPCSPISLACLLIQHNQSLLLSVLSHLHI